MKVRKHENIKKDLDIAKKYLDVAGSIRKLSRFLKNILSLLIVVIKKAKTILDVSKEAPRENTR